MNKEAKIVSITGTGRSGTNITKKIFSMHPKVHTLPFEYRFVVDPGGIIDFYNSLSYSWSPYGADKKIKELEEFLLKLAEKSKEDSIKSSIIKKDDPSGRIKAPASYFGWELNEWLPNFDNHVRKMIGELKTFDYSGCWPGTKSYVENNRIWFSEFKSREKLAEIIRRFINNSHSEMLQKAAKEFFVEDNTWNLLFASELLEILPQLKIIHIIRDPRDVIASFKQQRWCPDSTKQATLWYKSIIEKWFYNKKNISTEKYLEVKLEELVLNKKELISKMCNFSEMEFEENMLSVDLGQSNSGRWKNQFNDDEKTYLNQELKGILELLNYS